MKNSMDIAFLDAGEDGKIALQIAADDERVVRSVTEDDRGATAAYVEGILSRHGKYVAVVWQSERVMKNLGRSVFGTRAVVDLYHAAWMITAAVPEVRDRKLDSFAKWCDVEPPKNDSPSEIVRVTRQCYFMLLRRVEIGLKVEGVGRAVLTDVVSKAAEFIGKLGEKKEEA